jgi:hypothetical protein
MPRKGTIHRKGAHWSIDKLKASASPSDDRSVTWECPEDRACEFVVWFPSRRNPLDGPNEVYSRNGIAEAKVKADDGHVVTKGKEFHYSILLIGAGKEDIVVGNSPPTMIIE